MRTANGLGLLATPVLLLAALLLTVACAGGEEQATPTKTLEPLASSPTRATTDPTLDSTPGAGLRTYSNPVFKVELQYPAGWVPDYDYSTDACDDGIAEVYTDPGGREYGFFQVSAAGAPLLNLDEVTQTSAGHKLRPYGPTPQIVALTVDGRDARLILPDEAAPPPEPVAELIAPYSAPIVLRSPPPGEPADSYNYLVVYAHKDFIRSIANSVKLNEQRMDSEPFLFCGGPTPPPSP